MSQLDLVCTLVEEVSHLIQLDSESHVQARKFGHLPTVHALRHKEMLQDYYLCNCFIIATVTLVHITVNPLCYL